MGSGGEIGQQLVMHEQIDAVTFTGSVDVGKSIARNAITNLTKVQMEMGSKNALIVAHDADIDTAVQCAVGGAFGGTGQKCTASSRIIVDARVYDTFVQAFVEGTEKLRVGHALDESTNIGPVVSQEQLDMNMHNIEKAKREGCEVISGGHRVEGKTHGFYMAPTILDKTDNAYAINREELFAPITSLIKADDYQHALSIANDTVFGLTGGIVTTSLRTATAFQKTYKYRLRDG